MQLLRNFVFIAFLASLLVADGYQEYMQTKCGTNQFQCKSEQCVDDWMQCDGVNNCDDGSDETLELCSSLKCPPFSFKCAYGACIYSNLKCDGIKNCRDNSDEEGCIEYIHSRVNVEIPTGNDCVLPEFPDRGKWLLAGSKDFLPGDIVPATTFLVFTCQPNYSLMPDKPLIECYKTFEDLPKCVKTCPSVFGNNFLTLLCVREGKVVPCTNPYEGTRAIVRCNNLNEVPSRAFGRFRYCHNGSWDNWQPKCEQVVSFVAPNNVGNLRSALERAKPCVKARDPMPTRDTKQETTYLFTTIYVHLMKGEVSGISDYSIDEITEKVNSPTSSTFKVKITFNYLEINYDYTGSWTAFYNSGKLKTTAKGSVVQYKIDKTNGKYGNGYVTLLNSGLEYLEFNGGFLGAFLELFQVVLSEICRRISSEIIKPEILGIVTACLPAS